MKDFGKAALGVLKSLAPTVATALGGPFAGMAVAAVAKKLGVEQDEVEKVLLAGDPEQFAKVKQAEQDFKKSMRELDIREAELHQQDRGSARDLAKQAGIWPHVTLSTLWTLAYFAALYMVLSGKIDVGEHKALAESLLITLTVVQGQVLAFWFGSSSGSKQKTAALSLSKPAD